MDKKTQAPTSKPAQANQPAKPAATNSEPLPMAPLRLLRRL